MSGAPGTVGPLAALAVSREGARLVGRLLERWPELEAHVVEPYHLETPAARGALPPLGGLVGELFGRTRGLVLVMPVGAAVRLLVPWLRDKRVDPGVVVVDDGGKFAVSLLAGHAGGGNELARAIARALRARAVITTAAERRGLPVLEQLGHEYGWKLEAGREALLRASAALVDGGRLPVYQDAGRPSAAGRWRRVFVRTASPADDVGGAEPLVVVSDRCLPSNLESRAVVYRPPTLAVGVGCSSGAPAAEIVALIGRALKQGDLAPGSLARAGTLDRKLEEPGLMAAAAQLGLPMAGFGADELRQVRVPNPSPIVEEAVGTPSVAEAAAILASGGGRLVVTKLIGKHVTVAMARVRPR